MSNIGNEMQFIEEREELKTKAQLLLERAKQLEKNRKLVQYRLNRNTILLVTPGRKMVLERDSKLDTSNRVLVD